MLQKLHESCRVMYEWWFVTQNFYTEQGLTDTTIGTSGQHVSITNLLKLLLLKE